MYLMNRPWSPPSAGQDRGTAWHPTQHFWARGRDGRSPPSPRCRNAVMSRATPEPPGGPVVSALVPNPASPLSSQRLPAPRTLDVPDVGLGA